MNRLEYTVLDMMDALSRNMRAQPLNLGGIAGVGGGLGGPPGGFIGYLPQTRVAYDQDEIASSGTPASGMSLLDNLNHIRYRIEELETYGILVVDEFDGSPSISNVTRITFSGGATVTDAGGGRVIVNITASGGGGGGIADAPSDGEIYGRQDAAWVVLDDTYLRLDASNDPVTGSLLFNIDSDTTTITAIHTLGAGETFTSSIFGLVRTGDGPGPSSQGSYSLDSYGLDLYDVHPYVLYSGGIIRHRHSSTTLAQINGYVGTNGTVVLFNSYNDITASGRLLSLQNQDNEIFGVNGDGTVTIPSGQTYNVGGSPHTHAESGAWTLIEDKLLASADAASFDFQSIPATYKHLIIFFSARSDRAGADNDGVKIKINNDTGNTYLGRIQWTGGSAEQTSAGGPFWISYITAADSPANYFSNSIITLFDYANAVTYKSIQGRGDDIENTGAGQQFIYDATNKWLSTSAISRITIYPVTGSNFKRYSRATLYGM